MFGPLRPALFITLAILLLPALASATSGRFDSNCRSCHANDNRTCIGCHEHGNPNSASVSRTVFAPGTTVTVTLNGRTSGERAGGWARAMLFDHANQEIRAARITGPTGMGDDGVSNARLRYNFTLRAPAPMQAGSYTWAAAWYGAGNSQNHSGSNNTERRNVTFSVVVPACGVTIQSGAAFTSSTGVNLAISVVAPGLSFTQMRLSHDGTSWMAWQAYSPARAWTLQSGDGVKTVYVQFQETSGYVTNAVTDTIVLDTAPSTGTLAINAGAPKTISTAVTLSISASDTATSVAAMRFSADGQTWGAWEPYAATKDWTLEAGYGEKAVHAQFRDAAGNVSAAVSDTIIFQAPPTGARHWRIYR